MSSEAGRQQWQDLGRSVKADLRSTLYRVIMLVNLAKNSSAGQKSPSS